jgi:hypothetical protein
MRRGIDGERDKGGGEWEMEKGSGQAGSRGGRWQRIRGRKAGWWLVDLGFFCCFYMRWKGSGLLTGHLF